MSDISTLNPHLKKHSVLFIRQGFDHLVIKYLFYLIFKVIFIFKLRIKQYLALKIINSFLNLCFKKILQYIQIYPQLDT